MNKITVLLLLTFISLQFTAQENEESRFPQDVNTKHELKINAFSLIALSSFNVSYEYLIDKDSSFGTDLFINFESSDDINFPRNFSLTPYYRWFFSESLAARGFFVEAFGMLNVSESNNYDYYYDSNGNYINYDNSKVTDFALGISVGGKFITKKRFVAEVYLGVGRNLLNQKNNTYETDNIVTRGGISLGYRF